MQLLPTSSTIASAASRFDSLNGSGDAARHFMELFAGLMGATPAEISPDLNGDAGSSAEGSATSDENLIAAQAPYNTAAFSGTRSTAALRLTDAELRLAAENLRGLDADPAVILRVEDLTGNPGGVSVADVVRAAVAEDPARLTEVDLSNIESLIHEIDPSGELAEPVLESLRDGRTDEAWNMVQQAIDSLDPAQEVTVSKEEALSLGKALGLSAEELGKLEKAFGNQDSLRLTSEGLNALFAPAAQHMKARAENRSRLAAQLEAALTPVVRDARKRVEAELAAEGRASRDVQYSKTVIEDTVTRNGLARQHVGEDRALEETAEKTRFGNVRQDGEARNADTRNPEFRNTEKSADAAFGPADMNNAARNRAGTGGDADAGRNTGRDARRAVPSFAEHAAESAKQSASRSDMWDALLQRLNVQSSAAGLNASSAGARAASTFNAAGTGAASNPGAALSARALAQVEQAVLSAMRDGAARLEITLTPETLGTLSVILTSRNGEVSAVLRPERPETAQMLAQQTEHLRAVLEQQGLRVEKVEVQTQLQDNQSALNWHGTDQHNEYRERQARSTQVERNRRLIGLRRADLAAEAAARAAQQARPSGLTAQGLHLVA